jgi:predicted small lipoprotein YifL
MRAILKIATLCVAGALALTGCSNKPLNLPAGQEA